MSATVNKPTNEKLKEQDVNSKLQLYGIYSAFANGKVPSNRQIDVAMNSALESKMLASPPKELSEEGRHLVADLRDVIEKAKILTLTKNEGNLLQDFIWQTQHLGSGNAKIPGAPVDKDTAKQHGNEALDGLRTLGTLIISNGQFRKLLSDATVLLRSIAGDTATKAATKVQPSDEALNRMDEPAEENTWHDVPNLSRDNIRNQIKTKTPFNKGDAKKAMGDASEASNPAGERDPAATADLAAREQQEEPGQETSTDPVAGAKSGLNTLKDQTSDAIPDEKKDQAKQYKTRTNNYLKSKMPKERREQTIWRLKKMVVEIQGHQDYQRAIETLLRLAEEYTGHTKNVGQQSTGAIKGAHTDDSLQLAEADLKTLIERFANGTSSDDLFDSINQIYRDADRDPELKGWFKKLDGYVRKCLQEQGYIMQDQATDDWNALYDQGNYLLRDKYRGHTDRVVDEIKYIGNQFDNDPQNKAFAASVEKLFLDLGNDENGNPTFKKHLIKDLTEVIIPKMLSHGSYFPIPRIEYSDPMMDCVVENLIIESDNLMPNSLEFGSDNYWKFGRKTATNKNKNKIMLAVSGVQMDLHDVAFYVKKKKGFPSITDTGVADIFMGGEGFSFKVETETADKGMREHIFKVTNVVVNVKNMNIKVKQSKHKLLFALAKPILLLVLRPAIQKILEKVIKDKANEADSILWEIQNEVDSAKAEFKRNPDPENVQNMYQRYATAANKKLMQGKEKKKELEAKTADKKVNMAMTQHDSIFPTIKLPGGVSTKATEYKDLAAKGEKWESPVFSIGSAKETTSLPKVGAVTRRSGAKGSSMTTGATNGQTNGQSTQGLSNQMDQAFGSNSGSNTIGSSTIDKANGALNGNAGPTSSSQGTTLGQQNPVLTGSV